METYLEADLRPILKISPRQQIVYLKGVDEDKLYRGYGTLSDQDKQPQPERQKSINVIQSQYNQDLLMTRMFSANLMEIMEKIYMMMKILQTMTWRTR